MKKNYVRKFSSLSHFILEKMIEASDTTIEILYPYGYSGTALMRKLLSRNWRGRSPSRASFSSILTKMRKQGLVVRGGSRHDPKWNITHAGRRTLVEYRIKADAMEERMPLFSKSKDDGITRIVTFDIPERERKKRDILRDCLREVGFRQLQKSVWIGTAPIPEDFIHHLKNRGIFRYTHIASINKTGTIEN